MRPVIAESNWPPPLPPWAKNLISKTGFSFLKTATESKTNDFDCFGNPDGPKILLPEKVRIVFEEEAKKDFEDLVQYNVNIKQAEEDMPDPQKVFGPIYIVRGFDNIAVYGLHVNGWGSVGDSIGNLFCFVIYDSKKEKIVKEPIWTSLRWVDLSFENPFVSFEDITGDGDKEIVVQEVLHNGTETSALYYYYSICTDFSLKEILDLETRLTPVGDWWDEGYTSIDRKIIGHQKNQITVEVTMKGDDKPIIDIGTMILKRDNAYSPFKIFQKNVKTKDGVLKELLYINAGNDL